MTHHVRHGPPSAHAQRSVRGRLLARCAGWARYGHTSMFGLAHHATWYDNLAGRLNRPLYRRIVEDVARAGLPDGAVVLDVGTGPGRVPLLLAQRCPSIHVEGIDLSEQMIDQANRLAAEAGISPERLTYQVADAAALPYPDSSVDLIVSSLSLHHWADVPAGLLEIRRVLRPGGRAWIYDIHRVLGRVTSDAPHDDVHVTLGPLAPDRQRRGLAALLAAIGGLLIGRLEVRSATAEDAT
jgi:ubiquinone/menaquinone biosynthesis C-methylase UbiE